MGIAPFDKCRQISTTTRNVVLVNISKGPDRTGGAKTNNSKAAPNFLIAHMLNRRPSAHPGLSIMLAQWDLPIMLAQWGPSYAQVNSERMCKFLLGIRL
jgi:hypothetical protein